MWIWIICGVVAYCTFVMVVATVIGRHMRGL
jgi:hypothetical protein